MADSAWKLLNFDSLSSIALVDADKEDTEAKDVKETKTKAKPTAKTTVEAKTETEQVQVLAEVA